MALVDEVPFSHWRYFFFSLALEKHHFARWKTNLDTDRDSFCPKTANDTAFAQATNTLIQITAASRSRLAVTTHCTLFISPLTSNQSKRSTSTARLHTREPESHTPATDIGPGLGVGLFVGLGVGLFVFELLVEVEGSEDLELLAEFVGLGGGLFVGIGRVLLVSEALELLAALTLLRVVTFFSTTNANDGRAADAANSFL